MTSARRSDGDSETPLVSVRLAMSVASLVFHCRREVNGDGSCEHEVRLLKIDVSVEGVVAGTPLETHSSLGISRNQRFAVSDDG